MKKVDTLIVNGEIVDGTGRPRYHSDVAIKNGVIVEIGQNLSRKSRSGWSDHVKVTL